MTTTRTDALMDDLGRLAILLDAPMTADRLVEYVEALDGFELVDLQVAIKRAGRECDFFPRPVHLRAWAAEARDIRQLAERNGRPVLEPLSPEEQQAADEAYQVFLAKAREVLRRRAFPEAGR